MSCSDDQVIVVRGSQQAIDLCARILLDPGDRVIIEDPCYPGARGVFVASGARVVTAPVDVDGMDVRSRGFRSGGARLAYTTPSHQYPSGVVLALPRRLELLEWASRELGYILEDDYDSEYRYFGRPIESLQGLDGGERVIYTGSFSKLVFPALRLGFVVLPKALLPAFSAAKGLSDAGSATLEQLAMTDFIRDGHFARHVRRSRLRNAARRAALLEAIADFLGDRVEVSGGTAGIHLLIRLPRVAAEKTDLYARRAREARVGVYSAASCFHRRMKSASFVLGYNALTTEEIREGIEALSGAW